MKVVSAKTMSKIDKKATKRYGIPAIILMENAAIASAFAVLKILKARQRNIIFFCGQGNNGGDGFACARHVINHGLKVKVFFVGKKEKLTSEAKINFNILQKMGQKILKPKLSTVQKELCAADLVVDALLGIGLKSKVRQPTYNLIKCINSSKKPILSLDIPSGLDATTGKIYGIAVQANCTITFGLLKKGLLNSQAKNLAGNLIIADIGLPRQLLL